MCLASKYTAVTFPLPMTRKGQVSVTDRINKRIFTGSNLIKLVRIVNEDVDSPMKPFNHELSLVSESIEETAQRLGRLYDAIEIGKLDLDDIAIRIREVRTRQDQLHVRRLEIESQLSDRKV